jgi:hypothetical protein
MLGQSDGPLGSHAAKVLAVELTEGDQSDPALLRPLGQPRSLSLLLFFYDAWADAAQHLAKGDVLDVGAPSTCTHPCTHETRAVGVGVPLARNGYLLYR